MAGMRGWGREAVVLCGGVQTHCTAACVRYSRASDPRRDSVQVCGRGVALRRPSAPPRETQAVISLYLRAYTV